MVTFDGDDPIPLNYIERTAYYYSQLGFGKPYEWDHNVDIPFTKLKKPLGDSVVAIITTAAPFVAHLGDQGPGAPYNADAKYFTVYCGETSTLPDLRISHIAIDRHNTSAEDLGSFFPLAALWQAAADRRIGAVSKKFYGLPTNRSKRITKNIDCTDILERCLADGVDAAILVPNCPVCHQSVSIAARTLEAGGIPSVVMGCAKDIVERAGVSRFLFNDFPLGNSAGRPHDPQSQKIIVNLALDLLEQAEEPNTTWQSPLTWVGKSNWKTYYSNPDLLSANEIAERKAQFEEGKAKAKALRMKVGK
jgi:D-proline reductase (dithiol) PrdB